MLRRIGAGISESSFARRTLHWFEEQCSAEQFDFGRVEGRAVEAALDGGLVTSNAGALLLAAPIGRLIWWGALQIVFSTVAVRI